MRILSLILASQLISISKETDRNQYRVVQVNNKVFTFFPLFSLLFIYVFSPTGVSMSLLCPLPLLSSPVSQSVLLPCFASALFFFTFSPHFLGEHDMG